MYHTILKLEFRTGGRTVIVRKGDGDDWAAYDLPQGVSEQNGSLNKLYPRELKALGIDVLMEQVFPNLSYRA